MFTSFLIAAVIFMTNLISTNEPQKVVPPVDPALEGIAISQTATVTIIPKGAYSLPSNYIGYPWINTWNCIFPDLGPIVSWSCTRDPTVWTGPCIFGVFFIVSQDWHYFRIDDCEGDQIAVVHPTTKDLWIYGSYIEPNKLGEQLAGIYYPCESK